jgi:RNA polymerase sigma-70 factor (ECF subfamily)
MTANIEAGREMARDAAQQREAYSALAKSLESDLLRHGLRLTNGDLDWAKDLAQDTIVAGYPIYLEGKLAAERNIRAWFLRVLTNRFINQYNRKRKWTSDSTVEDVDAQRISTDGPEVPGEALERTLLDEPLENALAALPEEQRLCVLLVDIEEMEYAEAARLLEIPVGTVRSRLARARLRLYTLLLPYARSRRLA